MTKSSLANSVFHVSFDERGAMTALRFPDDPFEANFALSTAQEKWVPEEKQWGLGFLSMGHEREQITECTGGTVSGNTAVFTYRIPMTDPRHCCIWSGDREESTVHYELEMTVTRELTEEGLTETFALRNPSGHYIALDEVGLYSSFHDTYVVEDHALERHVNQHFFAGGDLCYIEAPRQSGNPPHVGLIVLSGNVASYQVEELNSSNFRGVIALVSKEVRIAPGKTWTLKRLVVPYTDRAEFEKIICEKTGFPVLDYGYLTLIEGESFRFRFRDRGQFESASIGGLPMEDDGECLTFTPAYPGEYSGRIRFAGGKIARIRLRVIEDPAKLLKRRADFIVEKQQLRDPADPRDGAFLCYDNLAEKIIRFEDIAAMYYSIPDRNDARERMGMGAFLAAYARIYKDDSYIPALKRYDAFLEKYIIDENYDVWDNYEQQKGAIHHFHAINMTFNSEDSDMRYRTFNYVFALAYETEMYWLTKETHYAEMTAGLLRRYIEKYDIGGNTCMFGVDVNAVFVLRDAGMKEFADEVFAYLTRRVYYLKKIDDRYDPSEVVYEQGTSASAMREIADYYIETKDPEVWDILEKSRIRNMAFEGNQPDYRSYHAPTIHWDDFWFGGIERWGDTMPHYWDTISADAYCMYAKISGDPFYLELADYIFRNNLALIEPDGSCWNCFVFPEKVNGRPAACLDPWANDQDWAFYTYLKANEIKNREF